MSKRFNFNVQSNFKEAIGKDSLIDTASALLTPVIYILAPSLLGLSGWTGWLVGGGATWLLGAALNIPGLRAGAIGAMAVHVVYAKFSGELAKWSITPFMLSGGDFTGATAPPIDTGNTAKGLRSYRTDMKGLRGYNQPGAKSISSGDNIAYQARVMDGLAEEMWEQQPRQRWEVN